MEVRGSETNPYRIALSLRDWVNNAMTPDRVDRRASLRYRHLPADGAASVATMPPSIPRWPARPGCRPVCAAASSTAIFRAKAGFYYHAWAESWVGKWVAVDPTLFDPSHPVNYVDATHIKFAQGDVTQMFQMVSIVGRLKITVE